MVEDSGTPITPEKQLLKLIEDPSSNNLTKAKGTYKTKRVFSSNFFKSGLSLFSKKKGAGQHSGQEISVNFQTVNWVLKLCVVAALVYLVIDIAASMQDSSKTPKLFGEITKIQEAAVKVAEVQPGLNPLSHYMDKIKKRDIFSPYEEELPEEEEEVIEVEEAPPAMASDGAVAFLDDLELVGIAQSADPDAIIHNHKVGRTFFVNKGAHFMDATVKDITETSVVIEYEGEEIELR